MPTFVTKIVRAETQENAKPDPKFEYPDNIASSAFVHMGRENTGIDTAIALPGERRLLVSGSVSLSEREALAASLGSRASPQQSDLELIALGYLKWGETCAARLCGEFAFVIYDPETSNVFAARDRIGLRPLYYGATDDCLYFAPLFRDIVRHDALRGAPDILHIAQAASAAVGYDTDSTQYEDIRPLPPASIFVSQGHDIQVSKYWHPEDAPLINLKSPDDYVEMGQDLFRKAVGDALQGHENIASHVSGGIDSAALTCMSADILGPTAGERLTGYVMAPEPESLETALPDQKRIATILDHCGIKPYRMQNLLEHTVDCVRRSPEDHILVPLPAYELDFLEHADANNITAILSGVGGDETLTHSGSRSLHDIIRKGKFGEALTQLREMKKGNPFAHFIIRGLLPFFGNEVLGWYNTLSNGRVKRPQPYLTDDLQKVLDEARITNPIMEGRYLSPREWQIEKIKNGSMAIRHHVWSQEALERGIVYRSPMMDQRIVDFALGVPPWIFVREGAQRWLGRKVMSECVPHDIAWFLGKYDDAFFVQRDKDALEILRTLTSELEENRERIIGSPYIKVERLLSDMAKFSTGKQNAPFGKITSALMVLDWTSEAKLNDAKVA